MTSFSNGHEPGATLLDWSFGYHWWFDVFRLVIIASAGAIFGVGLMRALRWRVYHWTLKRVAGFLATIWVGLLCGVQEYEQLGHPMVWWRLPGYTVFIALASIFVFAREQIADQDWRWSQINREQAEKPSEE